MTYNKQTWVDGVGGNTPINAARLNVMENGISAAHDPQSYPIAWVRQTSASGAYTAGAWGSIAFHIADIDTAGMTNLATLNSRFTVPAGQAGIYEFQGSVVITGGTDSQWLGARIVKNGTIFTQSWGSSGGLGASTGGSAFASTIVTMAVGDYVELQGYSNVAWGTRYSAATDGGGCWFSGKRLR
jgi:hypothetical protein